ncbi:MAG: hypothetical protein ACI8PP_002922, partial [Candidatus Pseudothioglobus sp.]
MSDQTHNDSATNHVNNYQTIKIEKQGQVDWLTLNRPEALNA